jgi:hypothetical protein
MTGGSKGASSARLCKKAYRKPNQEAEMRSKGLRPPRSCRSTLLAHSGLTDAHASWPQQARTRSQDRPVCLRLPDRATAPRRPKTTSRNAPAARPTCRRPCPPPLREYHRDRGNFVGRPPSRARGRQKWPPRCRHSPRQSQVLQVAKPTTSPGRGRAMTGQLKQIPMFAQVSFYRKHCARARDRVEQPARADRRRLPLAELTRRGRCGPGLGRPGPAPRRAGKSASTSRLAPGSEIGSACQG